MDTNNKTPNVYDVLAIVQSRLKVPKDKYNSYGKYHYRTCESILEAAKEITKDMDAVLMLTDRIELIGSRYYVVAKATLLSLQDGSNVWSEGWAHEADSRAGMDVAQVTGAASSYARKYALNALFAIDDSRDDPDQAQPSKPGTVSAGDSAEAGPTLEEALRAADSCKSRADYIAWWHTYKQLGDSTEIKDKAKELGLKFPKK